MRDWREGEKGGGGGGHLVSPRYIYRPVITPKKKMAAGFSGALQLTDLDDFITPSQVSKMFKVQNVCFLN